MDDSSDIDTGSLRPRELAKVVVRVWRERGHRAAVKTHDSDVFVVTRSRSESYPDSGYDRLILVKTSGSFGQDDAEYLLRTASRANASKAYVVHTDTVELLVDTDDIQFVPARRLLDEVDPDDVTDLSADDSILIDRRRLLLAAATVAGLGIGVTLVLNLLNSPNEVNPGSTSSGTVPSDDPSAWSQFQHDAANTGYISYGTEDSLTDTWSYPTRGSLVSSPAVADGRVFFGSKDGSLYAVDSETSETAWSYSTRAGIASSPAAVGDRVYVGSNDGSLYAVDAESGDRIWEHSTDGGVVSSPAVVGGTVFFGSRDASLYAVDAESGDRLWSYETGFDVVSSPAVVGGTVFFGSRDASLYAVDAESGDRLWRYETGEPVNSSPAAVDGTVYFGGLDSNLYAVDADTGEETWRKSTDGQIRSSPAVDVEDDRIYVSSLDRRLYCLTLDGDEVWTYDARSQMRPSPAVTRNTVYVGDSDGVLHAVDAESGDRVTTHSLGERIISSPAVVEGSLYVGDDSGELHSLGLVETDG
ncbi:PQQ-binding-like beta-propeller repeat protein [Halorutilales archaeon Cl-col2-1]